MIFQMIDAADYRFRMWTGSAVGAISRKDNLQRDGRQVSVADYKGRRLTATDLIECAKRENQTHAVASLRLFKRSIAAAAPALLDGSSPTAVLSDEGKTPSGR